MQNAPILFIDDNLCCHLDNCQILRDRGFVVQEAYSAPEAVELIDHQEPLLALVTDVDLGEGADGFEIARHARAAYPHLPVVYISGASAGRHYSEGVKGSVFIPKPFQPHQIVEALDRVILNEAA